MDKAKAIGFLLFFYVVFLMIEETSGMFMGCVDRRTSNLPVSAVLLLLLLFFLFNFRA